MKRRNERRDIRRFSEALIAAGVGVKDGGWARYRRVFHSYTEEDWRLIIQV